MYEGRPGVLAFVRSLTRQTRGRGLEVWLDEQPEKHGLAASITVLIAPPAHPGVVSNRFAAVVSIAQCESHGGKSGEWAAGQLLRDFNAHFPPTNHA